jgi:DNA polymerase III delta prime subunit
MLAREHTLFTEKFRPTNPTDYIGNDDFKQDLNQWIEKQDLPHLLLHGGAGGGKTTAAKLHEPIFFLSVYKVISVHCPVMIPLKIPIPLFLSVKQKVSFFCSNFFIPVTKIFI